MAKASVTLSGTLMLPSGLPAAKASVRFTLSGPNVTGTAVVVPTSVTGIANQDGTFSVSIVPNAPYSFYTVTVFRETGRQIMDTIVFIPQHDCLFSKIIQTRALPSLNAAQAALADLQEAQAGIESARVSVVAMATKTSAGSAEALVQLESAVGAYKKTIKDTQNTIAGLVDTAMVSSIDLVTAYQLSK